MTAHKELIITEVAATDIEDIAGYVAAQNPYAAERFLLELKQRIQVLAEQPEIGRCRDEVEKGARSFTINDYVIFYKPVENDVVVGRVLHGSRDIQKALDKSILHDLFTARRLLKQGFPNAEDKERS